MRKVICVIAVMGLTVAWAAPAQAASHSIDSTIKLSVVEQTGSPGVSGTAQYAGTFKGALGSGATVGNIVYPGPVGAFTATFKIYLNKGTLTGTLDGTGSPAPGGGLNYTGSGEITKGNGKYKGAHGKFTFTGSQPSDSPVATQLVKGSVKY